MRWAAGREAFDFPELRTFREFSVFGLHRATVSGKIETVIMGRTVEPMAREMALAGVNPEELRPSNQAPQPLSPKQKWENFWYHYKWVVIACVCGALLVVFFAVEMLQKNPPDYTVVLAADRGYLSGELEPLRQMLVQYGQDIDGDSEVEVKIISHQLGGNGTRESQLANFQALQMHLASGDVLLFAFEPMYYTWMKETMEEKGYEFFTPLPTDIVGVGEDGCHWCWSKAPEADISTANPLPETLYFGVRLATGSAADRTEEHAQCMELLTAMMQQQATAAAYGE